MYPLVSLDLHTDQVPSTYCAVSLCFALFRRARPRPLTVSHSRCPVTVRSCCIGCAGANDIHTCMQFPSAWCIIPCMLCSLRLSTLSVRACSSGCWTFPHMTPLTLQRQDTHTHLRPPPTHIHTHPHTRVEKMGVTTSDSHHMIAIHPLPLWRLLWRYLCRCLCHCHLCCCAGGCCAVPGHCFAPRRGCTVRVLCASQSATWPARPTQQRQQQLLGGTMGRVCGGGGAHRHGRCQPRRRNTRARVSSCMSCKQQQQQQQQQQWVLEPPACTCHAEVSLSSRPG